MSKTKMLAFRLRGQFQGFAAPGAKLMRLATPTGEFTIKLSKALRPSLNRTLILGDWVEVSGYQKLDAESGRLKLKAEQVQALAAQFSSSAMTAACSDPALALVQPTAIAPVARATQVAQRRQEILVCQKSDCCKLGGNALVRELQAELTERGLAGIQIKGTGCMKRCKSGPNLIMPDKSRYSRIQASEVSALLDQHFPGSNEIAS